jgi:hypothetical protein
MEFYTRGTRGILVRAGVVFIFGFPPNPSPTGTTVIAKGAGRHPGKSPPRIPAPQGGARTGHCRVGDVATLRSPRLGRGGFPDPFPGCLRAPFAITVSPVGAEDSRMIHRKNHTHLSPTHFTSSSLRDSSSSQSQNPSCAFCVEFPEGQLRSGNLCFQTARESRISSAWRVGLSSHTRGHCCGKNGRMES